MAHPHLSYSLFCLVKPIIHIPASMRQEKSAEKMQTELLLSAEEKEISKDAEDTFFK